MQIPFSPPYIDESIINEVTDALRSGWITTGPKTKQLEKELAGYCGVDRMLCLNSATAGMELMLRWYGVKPGDEVIVPAYTYTATASVVLHCGATPVMVDVDDNFQINIAQAEKAINARTKAIIPVDIFGMPVEYDQLKAVLERNKHLFTPESANQEILGRPMLLVDAAHSVGAEYKGRKVGSQADAMVFSFHAVKNLTTAEGGAIAFNLPGFDADEVYRELNIKGLHGQTKDALSKSQLGSWKYDVVEAGYKYNMPDVLAAIGLASFKQYDNFILPRRKEIFDTYSQFFSQYDWAQLPVYETGDRTSSYHVYPLRVNDITEEDRDQIIIGMGQAGVATNVHYQPMPLLSLYRGMGYKADDYPVSIDNYSREISLPVYPQLTEEQLDYIVRSMADIVEKIYAKKAV